MVGRRAAVMLSAWVDHSTGRSQFRQNGAPTAGTSTVSPQWQTTHCVAQSSQVRTPGADVRWEPSPQCGQCSVWVFMGDWAVAAMATSFLSQSLAGAGVPASVKTGPLKARASAAVIT